MKPLGAGALLLLSLAGCHPAKPLLSVVRTIEPGGVRLALIATPGTRINARLRPALELNDGTVLRFDGVSLTPDSSYYTAPPELLIAGPLPRAGVIRASVCPAGESVCRLVVLPLPLPGPTAHLQPHAAPRLSQPHGPRPSADPAQTHPASRPYYQHP